MAGTRQRYSLVRRTSVFVIYANPFDPDGWHFSSLRGKAVVIATDGEDREYKAGLGLQWQLIALEANINGKAINLLGDDTDGELPGFAGPHPKVLSGAVDV